MLKTFDTSYFGRATIVEFSSTKATKSFIKRAKTNNVTAFLFNRRLRSLRSKRSYQKLSRLFDIFQVIRIFWNFLDLKDPLN